MSVSVLCTYDIDGFKRAQSRRAVTWWPNTPTLTNDRFYSAPAHRTGYAAVPVRMLNSIFFKPPKSGCPSYDRFMKGVEHMSAIFKV